MPRKAKKGNQISIDEEILNRSPRHPDGEENHHQELTLKVLNRSPNVSGGHWNFVQPEILLRIKDKCFPLHKAISSVQIQRSWNYNQACDSSAFHLAYCCQWIPWRKQKISSFSLSASWNWELFSPSDSKYTLKKNCQVYQKGQVNLRKLFGAECWLNSV